MGSLAAASGSPRRRWVALALALVFSGAAAVLIVLHRPGWLPVALWGGGVGIALAVALAETRVPRPDRRFLVVALAALAAVGLRMGLASAARIHGDELITAYFSATENLSTERFFAHVPAVRGEWVSQFPTPFFLLQRAFFAVFGESLAAVRWSVQPWVWLSLVLLFYLARELVDETTAWLALLLASFLAISLYLETLALHFISSTALLLAFLLAGARAVRTGGTGWAVAAGLACGGCYLFYTSSYLALPVLGLVMAWALVRRRWATLRLGVVTLGVCAVVLAPFAAAASHYNYFASRWAQVSLWSGQWSDLPERAARGESRFEVIVAHGVNCLRSLVERDRGGHGGYFFERQAMLEPFSALLLGTGVLLALGRLRRYPGLGVVLVTVAGAFSSGMVLTIPPPAFHRFSVAFPLLALLMALPLRAMLELSLAARRARLLAAACAVTLFAALNLGHFVRGSWNERAPEELRLGEYLNSRFPHKKLYMAAFPGYAYAKLAHFAPVRREALTITGYHADLLERFDAREDYLYVIAMPDIFGPQFQALDPHGRLVRFSTQYALFFN